MKKTIDRFFDFDFELVADWIINTLIFQALTHGVGIRYPREYNCLGGFGDSGERLDVIHGAIDIVRYCW